MVKHLKLVTEADRRPVESVSDAVEFGSRLDELVQMRKVIARSIDTTASARDLAALTKRLTEISKEIDVLRREAVEGGDADGEVSTAFDAEVV